MPFGAGRAKAMQMTAEKSKELRQRIARGLERGRVQARFRRDNTGWQFKYLTRGGGYYFNVGCSDLIRQ